MSRISKKLLISTIILICVLAGAFTFLSFSLADEPPTPGTPAASLSGASVNQMDRIIDNSINGTYGDPKYNILEISSSSTPSRLQEMVNKNTEGISKFKKYIIDAYKLQNDEMADNSFNFTFKQVTAPDSELLDAIDKADFIYIANDPKSMYSRDVDFTEDVKNALVNAATNENKPVMIDSFNITSSIGNADQKSIVKLIEREISGISTAYRQPNNGGSNFMTLSSANYSFSPIPGDNQSTKWGEDKTCKVLAIGKDSKASSYTMSNFAGLTEEGEKIALSGTVLQSRGYSLRGDHPKNANFKRVSINDIVDYINGLPANAGIDTYDYVILEAGITDAISDEQYNTIGAMALSGVKFLYSDSYATSNTITYNENKALAYAYILDKLATVDDFSRYANVLITSQSKIGNYANANSAKAERDIANIILNGSFRGVKGIDSGDDSSTVYTVLEIEPGYPIDLDLAKAFGNSYIFNNEKDRLSKSRFSNNDYLSFERATGRDGVNANNTEYGIYYLRNAAVRDDVTTDELAFGDGLPLSNYGDDSATRVTNLTARINALKQNNNEVLFDYYNWSLSKAKIAHATGLKYDEVKVVHMSTYEFNTSTKSLLDNYDAIYIGGDNSSIKASNYWRSADNQKYNMYFKYGETYDLKAFNDTNYSGKVTGNDINARKLEELKEYSSFLPVIVEKSVTNGSDGISGQVDPSSNMYNFLSSINGSSNTLWGFDASKTIKITNYEHQYGDTLGGYATVFTGLDKYAYDATDDADTDPNYHDEATGYKDAVDLRNTLKTQRPKFLITRRPLEYVEGNPNTYVTKNDLIWKYDLMGATGCEVRLYIDNNGNSKFEKSEIKERSNTDTLTYTGLSDSFTGPLYWKLELFKKTGEDEKGNPIGMSASVTGLTKIRFKERRKVHLLQIMPVTQTADNTKDTLYLCTECQHAKEVLYGGPWAGNNGFYSKASTLGMGDGYNAQSLNVGSAGATLSGTTTVGSKIDAYEILKGGTWRYANNATNIGTHTHIFGISKYIDDRCVYKDGNKNKQIHNENGYDFIGTDDWHTNWYDDIKNDYDVTVDILNINEYQALCAKVNRLYQSAGDDEKKIQSIRQTYVDASTDYKLYYDCMVEVINNVYYTSNSKISAVNKAKFEQFLVKDLGIGGSVDANGKVTYKTNPVYTVNGENVVTQNDATELLKGYGLAGDRCSDHIASYYNRIYPDSEVPGDPDYVKADLDYIMDKSTPANERRLYDFFSYFKDSFYNKGNNDWQTQCSNGFAIKYIPWRDAKALEEYFYDKYLENAELASVYNEEEDTANVGEKIGTFKLSGIWDCIAVGAADEFDNKDINELGCYTLLNYIKSEGNLILFHDSLVAKGSPGGGSTVTMTKILSDAFGMSGDSDVTCTFDKTTQQVKYSVKYNSDPNGSATSGQTITNRLLNTMMKDNSGSNEYIGINKFVEYDKQAETNQQTLHVDHDIRASIAGSNGGHTPTDKAERTNDGIITKFPFTIGDRLQITPTNAQGFAANVNDPNMTVYYTLEGGTAGGKSSMFAADPHDGINNYFLYQYGKITYTGAGHSLITGLGRNNNDERRLFINVIVNSSRPSVDGPSLNLYDFSSTLDDVPTSLTNNKVKIALDANDDENSTETDREEYVYYVDSMYDTPQFSIYPQLSDGTTIKNLEVFYDKDISGENKNVRNADDVLIFTSAEDKTNDVSSKLLKKMSENTSGLQSNGILKLDPSYFVGKDGTCAYLVVTVTDNADNPPMTKTIRIELKPELYELD